MLVCQFIVDYVPIHLLYFQYDRAPTPPIDIGNVLVPATPPEVYLNNPMIPVCWFIVDYAKTD